MSSELLSEWVQLQAKEFAGTRGFDEAELRSRCGEFPVQSPRCARTLRWTIHFSAGICACPRNSRINVDGSADTRVYTLRNGDIRVCFQAASIQAAETEFQDDAEGLGDAIWSSTVLIDKLGLYVTEIYQNNRNEVIQRQQEEMLELSTPVVKLWEGVLAVPLIGTLDSARTQVVMQNLLEAIVDTGSEIAIIDITGVPTVDTLVAQHLLKTVSAARLMGADCIISGIRPQIAQTIIHLGVDLSNVVTKATLADAFSLALRRSGMAIHREKGH